jgi:CelD/BcsL family acetyltransferase involved in cellulose biosynthesis
MSQTIAPCEAEASFDVRVHTTPDAFALPAWRELLGRDPARHVFATPEWHRVWWEEFAGDKELFVLELVRDGATAAIVPLYRKSERAGRLGETPEQPGRRVLRFVGGIDLTDYLGPICAPEDRPAVAGALVAWLRSGEVGWDELDAHNMPLRP